MSPGFWPFTPTPASSKISRMSASARAFSPLPIIAKPPLRRIASSCSDPEARPAALPSLVLVVLVVFVFLVVLLVVELFVVLVVFVVELVLVVVLVVVGLVV